MGVSQYPQSYAPQSNQGARGQVECPACTRARKVLFQSLSPDLLFPVAFDVWMSHRTIQTNGMPTEARFLAETSERDYQVCAKALGKFFGGSRLEQIGPAELIEYQQARVVNAIDARGAWRCERNGVVRSGSGRAKKDWTREEAELWAEKHGGDWEIVQRLWMHRASANCIRKEIALALRILKGARLWGEEQEQAFVRLRAVEADEDHALSLQQQHRLLHIAQQTLEFRFIFQYAILALQTTAGPNELRHVRLCDALPGDRILNVPRGGAKNKYRTRSIPLVTEEAKWALEGLIARARTLGAEQPTDYLFPLQVARTHYDPSRPMSESGLKKPWNALRRAAGMPKIRLYDLRHTGMTRMAEAGVPLPVARSFMGHMTRRMEQRYTAICMAAQRGWGEQVWGTGCRSDESPDGGGAIRDARAMSAWMPPRKPVASERFRAGLRVTSGI